MSPHRVRYPGSEAGLADALEGNVRLCEVGPAPTDRSGRPGDPGLDRYERPGPESGVRRFVPSSRSPPTCPPPPAPRWAVPRVIANPWSRCCPPRATTQPPAATALRARPPFARTTWFGAGFADGEAEPPPESQPGSAPNTATANTIAPTLALERTPLGPCHLESSMPAPGR